MYFDSLHKTTLENCSINVLKKSFLGQFRNLEFFRLLESTEFFFFLGLFKIFNGHELMYFDWLHLKTPEICSINVLEKSFWVGFGFSNFIRLIESSEFFFVLGLFKSL